MLAPAYCSSCGQARAAGAQFCSKCGTAFGASTISGPDPSAAWTQAAERRRRTVQQIRVVTWVVVLVCGAGFVWLWLNTGDTDTITKLVVTVMLGIVWSAIVVGIASVIVAALGLGTFLIRGPRR